MNVWWSMVLACVRTAPVARPLPAGEPASTLSFERPGEWLRASSVAVGCLFAQAGAAVEPTWRCGAPAAPIGDPCREVEAWTAGPAFPPSLRERLPVAVLNVRLGWERADLRQIVFELPLDADPGAVRSQLGLEPLPAGVTSIDVQSCSLTAHCLIVTGFDHLGAGDVDCGG